MSANKLLSLFISARRSSWRMIDWHANESDGRYAAVRKTILERDDYTCRFCSFKSPKYQHIHHVNHDHGNNKPENLVTACPLCHQCAHLGLSGVHSSGVIVYVPEVSQADLNNMARACFVAVHNGGKHEQAARDLYTALERRSEVIEEYFGPGTSNPSAFGQAFVEMKPDEYASRKTRMPGLRLLPRMQAFGAEIAFWQNNKAAYGAFADADWERVMPVLDSSVDEEAPSYDDGSDLDFVDISDDDSDGRLL